GNGDDHLAGNEGTDLIYGGDGNDTIEGDDSADTIDGGNGNDHIEGDQGNDSIFGGNGNDNITGDSGDDKIEGGNGDDRLDGGNAGEDTLSYAHAGGAVSVDLGTGIATGAEGTDTVSNFEDVTGSNFNDTISGDNLNN